MTAKWKWTSLAAPIVLAAILTGCASDGEQRSKEFTRDTREDAALFESREDRMARQQAEAKQEAPARPAPAAAQPAAAAAPAGMQRISMAFPTGQRATSAVLVEKLYPGEVTVGETFEYQIIVTNLSDLDLRDVIVTDDCDYKIEASSPGAERLPDGDTGWIIPSLPAGQSETIRVRASATSEGMLGCCATVRYDSALCNTITVTQPKLALKKEAPSEVLLCEPIPVKFTVTNNGTGDARNIRISDPLPNGLMTDQGQRTVNFTVDRLAAGQSRSFAVMLKADQKGNFENMATATADNNLKAESNKTTTRVRQPVLTINKTAPERRYLGRNAEFEITVKNEGDGVARNTILEDTLPNGGTVQSISNNGTRSGNKVVWNLGDLAPGQSRTVSVELGAGTIGELANSATVRADCASAVTDRASTLFEGIPAILLEVVDLDDPVEVGNQTTYVITATNQGSAADSNVTISVTLPEGLEFVSASGATAARADGKRINFEPLANLPAKQQATWRVVVRATRESDARTEFSMTSDQFKAPVRETESTNLYD